jgi:hypothetical protein
MQAPKPTGPPRFAIEATTERINGNFRASSWPRLRFSPSLSRFYFEPKQCWGWGRTTAGREGQREQASVGESAGPHGSAVGPVGRTARDGRTGRSRRVGVRRGRGAGVGRDGACGFTHLASGGSCGAVELAPAREQRRRRRGVPGAAEPLVRRSAAARILQQQTGLVGWNVLVKAEQKGEIIPNKKRKKDLNKSTEKYPAVSRIQRKIAPNKTMK